MAKSGSKKKQHKKMAADGSNSTFADEYFAGECLCRGLDNLGTEKGGVGLACYQVGEVTYGLTVSYELTRDFASSEVDLNGLEKARDYKSAAETLAKTATDGNPAYKAGVTDADGLFLFDNLEQGIYLIVQTDTASYGTIEPFLVSIPYMEDGQTWTYDVHTYTKGEKLPKSPKTTVKKTVRSSKVKTGDDLPIAGITAVLVISAAVIVIILVLYRRKK